MENVVQYIGIILVAIGVLAFFVSLITEVVKGVGALARIPTDILVFCLSIVLAVLTFAAGVSLFAFPPDWYMWVAAVIVGLMVAFVAMFGWDKFYKLWQRFKKKE